MFDFSIIAGAYPLETNLFCYLFSGWFKLFEYLLQHKYTEPQSRNLLDRSGSSLYHVVAKSTSGHESKALQILRRYRVRNQEPFCFNYAYAGKSFRLENAINFLRSAKFAKRAELTTPWQL